MQQKPLYYLLNRNINIAFVIIVLLGLVWVNFVSIYADNNEYCDIRIELEDSFEYEYIEEYQNRDCPIELGIKTFYVELNGIMFPLVNQILLRCHSLYDPEVSTPPPQGIIV